MDQVQERDNSFDGSESPRQRSSVNERASPQRSSMKFNSSFGNRLNGGGMATANVSYVDRPGRDGADADLSRPQSHASTKKGVRFSEKLEK